MVVTQQHDTPLSYQGQVLTRDALGGMKGVLYRQETVVTSSMVLDRHLILIAQMREIATSIVPYRSIKQVRVASLLVQPGKRKFDKLLALPEVTWPSLQGKDETGPIAFKTERLEHDSRSIITVGEFGPTRNGRLPVLVDGWSELSPDDAWEHVEGGGSIFVSGLPGVAKSYTCMAWVKELKKTRRVILTAPTHVPARTLKCEGLEPITLQRFYNRYIKADP